MNIEPKKKPEEKIYWEKTYEDYHEETYVPDETQEERDYYEREH